MKYHQLLRVIYWIGFVFSLHTALTVYINSSFLETKIPENLIGALYTASAIISIVGLYFIPRMIGKFGSRKVLGIIMLANIANIIAMVTSSHMILVAICFILFFTFNTLIYLGIDILIEHWSTSAVQGRVRGSYLTAVSMSYVLAPFIAGFIADRLGFSALYIFALIVSLPAIAIVLFQLPSITNAHPSKLNILQLARKFINHPELRRVFIINFILQFFYAWMVIYSPIYLHEHVGLAWDTIGLLFTFMLTAFVLLEYPVGKLIDRITGEKPVMILGLIIAGTATFFVTQAPAVTFWGLAGILFATRVGASMIEVSTESYFFKHVHHDDTGTIGFFRNTYPFAYIIAPLIASLILTVAPLWTLFIILGSICILGVSVAMNINR